MPCFQMGRLSAQVSEHISERRWHVSPDGRNTRPAQRLRSKPVPGGKRGVTPCNATSRYRPTPKVRRPTRMENPRQVGPQFQARVMSGGGTPESRSPVLSRDGADTGLGLTTPSDGQVVPTTRSIAPDANAEKNIRKMKADCGRGCAQFYADPFLVGACRAGPSCFQRCFQCQRARRACAPRCAPACCRATIWMRLARQSG